MINDVTLPIKTELGGVFVNPEFGLIVPSSFNAVDIIGQANETYVPGRFHFVLDKLHSSINKQDGEKAPKVLNPDNLPSHWRFLFRWQKVRLPHRQKVSTNLAFCL